jgi:P pilus assembly chaperone PapD
MSFHIRDTSPYTGIIEKLSNRNHTYNYIGKAVELLDSTGDVIISSKDKGFGIETQKINLTENQKSGPLIVESDSNHPTLMSLSINDKKNVLQKYLSIKPKIQEVSAHGKGVFYIDYNKVSIKQTLL